MLDIPLRQSIRLSVDKQDRQTGGKGRGGGGRWMHGCVDVTDERMCCNDDHLLFCSYANLVRCGTNRNGSGQTEIAYNCGQHTHGWEYRCHIPRSKTEPRGKILLHQR